MPYKDEEKKKMFGTMLEISEKQKAQISNFVEKTTEIPGNQVMVYKLLKLANNFETPKNEMVAQLTEHLTIAQAVVIAAKLPVNNSANIDKNSLKSAIDRVGYKSIFEKIYNDFLEAYSKIFKNCQEAEIQKVIKKSLKKAFIATELANIYDTENTTDIFFAALYQDLGTLVVALRDLRVHAEIETMTGKGMDQTSAETAILGFDTKVIAIKMLEKLNMPINFTNFYNQVLTEQQNVSESKAENIVKLANVIGEYFSNQDVRKAKSWDLVSKFLLALNPEATEKSWNEQMKILYLSTLKNENTLLR